MGIVVGQLVLLRSAFSTNRYRSMYYRACAVSDIPQIYMCVGDGKWRIKKIMYIEDEATEVMYAAIVPAPTATEISTIVTWIGLNNLAYGAQVYTWGGEMLAMDKGLTKTTSESSSHQFPKTDDGDYEGPFVLLIWFGDAAWTATKVISVYVQLESLSQTHSPST